MNINNDLKFKNYFRKINQRQNLQRRRILDQTNREKFFPQFD